MSASLARPVSASLASRQGQPAAGGRASRTLRAVRPTLPSFVVRAAERLSERGLRSAVIGRPLWADRPGPVVEARLLCETTSQQLHALPDVVCLGRDAAVLWPQPDGMIELESTAGQPLEAAIGGMPWTVLAIGFDPVAGEWLDPVGGRADLDARRLEVTPIPSAELWPRAGLAAARLTAELDLAATESGRGALRACAERWKLPLPGAPLRFELDALLLARAPATGIALLRETGLEARVVPGAGAGAARLVAGSSADLVDRWSAWLLGTRAPRILARLRTPTGRARAIEARLAYQPPERSIALRTASLRRAVQRLGGPEALHALLDLRHRQLAAEGGAPPEVAARLARIAELAESLAAPDAPPLAWSGHDVMQALRGPAGPAVGRALGYLRERVARDPAGNHPEQLARWLEEWSAEQDDAVSARADDPEPRG